MRIWGVCLNPATSSGLAPGFWLRLELQQPLPGAMGTGINPMNPGPPRTSPLRCGRGCCEAQAPSETPCSLLPGWRWRKSLCRRRQWCDDERGSCLRCQWGLGAMGGGPVVCKTWLYCPILTAALAMSTHLTQTASTSISDKGAGNFAPRHKHRAGYSSVSLCPVY